MIKIFLLSVQLLLVSGIAFSQSIIDANTKASYLLALNGKSIQRIKLAMMEDSTLLSSRLHEIKDYFEPAAKVVLMLVEENTTPYSVAADIAAMKQNLESASKNLVFDQYFKLPNSYCRIKVNEKANYSNSKYLNIPIEFSTQRAYANNAIIPMESIALHKVDSIYAVAKYTEPSSINVVTINADKRIVPFNGDTIFIDSLKEGYAAIHMPITLHKKLLEIHGLTIDGKLVDISRFLDGRPYEFDRRTEKTYKLYKDFLKNILVKIRTNAFANEAALLQYANTLLANIIWMTPSTNKYQEFTFSSKLKSLIFYFKDQEISVTKEVIVHIDRGYNSGIMYKIYEDFGTFGICDVKGNIIIPAKHNTLDQINDNYYQTSEEDGKENYFLDTRTKKLINIHFNGKLSSENDGYVTAYKSSNIDSDETLYGLYNNVGKMVLPIKYSSIEHVQHNIVAYKIKGDDELTIMNAKSGYILSGTYDNIEAIKDINDNVKHKVFKVSKNEKFWLIHDNTNAIKTEGYDNIIGYFSENLVRAVMRNNNTEFYGMIDSNMNEIVPLVYEDLENCENGLIVCKKNGSYGCLDSKGKMIIPNNYRKVSISEESIIARNDNRLYGLFDNNGKALAPFIFTNIGKFEADYAFVFTGNSYGIINRSGKFVMQMPHLDGYSSSKNGKGITTIYTINNIKYNYKGDVLKN